MAEYGPENEPPSQEPEHTVQEQVSQVTLVTDENKSVENIQKPDEHLANAVANIKLNHATAIPATSVPSNATKLKSKIPQPAARTVSATIKPKKFDLAASLKKPMTWKPYKGIFSNPGIVKPLESSIASVR